MAVAMIVRVPRVVVRMPVIMGVPVIMRPRVRVGVDQAARVAVAIAAEGLVCGRGHRLEASAMPTARSGPRPVRGGRPPGLARHRASTPMADSGTYGRVARPVKAMASFLPVIEWIASNARGFARMPR